MTLYKNKYRIESARCPNWDYTSNGSYFVTICTKHRQCFFGQVVDRQMHLSQIGTIVAEEWQKTPQIRSFIQLGSWVVMPNHFHGIITITNPANVDVETSRRDVSTSAPRLQPNSLGSIIGQFKSICTKRIWCAGFPDFAWQTRFHDRIIQDELAAARVQQYILNNPAQWSCDKHYSESK